MTAADLTLDAALSEWSAQYGDHTAVTDGQTAWDYRQLYEKTLVLADLLRKRGIVRGSRVIMQMTNTVWFPAVFFALSRIGAVPILCLPAHKELVIGGICRNAKPAAMIFTRRYLKFQYEEMAQNLAAQYGCAERLFFEDEFAALTSADADAALERERAVTDLPSADDLAFLSLSGGTTGIPKLIPRTHRDYLYNARVTAERAVLSAESVMLNILPAAHNFALGTPGIIGTLMCGGTVVMQKYPDITEFFANVEAYGVTITSLVPALVNMCIRYRNLFDDDDVSSLRYVMVGGAMFRPEEAEAAERLMHCTVIQVFGMSEGMTFMTDCDAPEQVRWHDQGKPSAPEDEYRIVDADGNDVPDGEAGEIIVRGPYTIRGYYENPDANRRSFNSEGYYLTGDRALRTPEGNVRILGRVREQINRAGEKIMPAALEEWICRSENVLECAVIGVPDAELGHKICVYAVTEKPMTLQELNAFLKGEQVSDFYLPDLLRLTDALPLTPVGKVDKNELLRMLEQEERS